MNVVNITPQSPADRKKEIVEDFNSWVKAANATNRHVTLPRLLAQSINAKALQ